MTMHTWSGQTARRALRVGVAALLVLAGTAGAAPGAPATPTAPSAPSGVAAVAVAVGSYYACALTAVGGVKCWGDNSDGQLGDGSTAGHRRPADVVGLTSGVTQVSAESTTTCAVTVVGGVKCWGEGRDGRLGHGSFTSSSTPVDVVGLGTGVASVSVGARTVCAVMVAKTVKCWGSGALGALGNGGTTSSAIPVDVVGIGSGARAVATGINGACALTAVGASCWGDDQWGQLGDGSSGGFRTTAGAVVGLGTDVTSVTASYRARCVVATRGRVLCWGYNGGGYLGIRSPLAAVPTPLAIRGFTGAAILDAGGNVTCAAGGAQTWCWGQNTFGAVGDGTLTDRTRPTPVTGLDGPTVSVATGYEDSCSVDTAGRVYCWGLNRTGQLGDGTRTDSPTPVRVVGLGA